MVRQLSLNGFTVLALLFMPFSFVLANNVGESVFIDGTLNDDTYAAGEKVDIRAQVMGDVVAAGGEISIDSTVSADIMAAGGQINIAGNIGDDIRAAGGDVIINAQVADDVVIAGGSLQVMPNTVIGGQAWLAGGEVDMAGKVGDVLRIAAGTMRLDTQVEGDVFLDGGEIDILAGTIIKGNLVYRSENEARIDPQAQIVGSVTREPGRWEHEGMEGGGIFLPLTLMVAGIALYLLFPGYTVSAAQTVATAPGKSVLLGLALLVSTPVTAFILMGSMIGIWIGLVLLVFYFVALIVALLIAAFFVGDAGAKLLKQDIQAKSKRILFFVAAVVVLSLLSLVPLIGGFIGFVLFLLGLGAGVLQVYQQYSALRLSH